MNNPSDTPQTASSLDFSSPTRRKRDDIVMEADTPLTQEEQTITSDSIALGWSGDEHKRMLLLIQDGKVIHYEIKNDSQIAGGHRTVVEHDVIDWAKGAIQKKGLNGAYQWKRGHRL